MARLHHFGKFRLDTAARELRSGDRPIPLRRKTFDLLAYLVRHPGLAIPKAELKAAVWPEVLVSDGVIRSTLKELREALGDAAAGTVHIETLHGVGVRFVAAVTVHGDHSREEGNPAPMSGRAAELQTLANRLADAVAGQRRFVLVVGEPGIGKTTLVEEFTARAGHRAGGPTIARGACAEERRDEALAPLLDALTPIVGPGAGANATSALRRTAPLWLPLLQPHLAPPDPAAWTGTPHRMNREGVLLFEELARDRPTLLVLEDLQWADDATLSILETLAARAEHLPLCVVLTCRSTDGPVLRRLLKLRRATILRLGALDEGEQFDVLRSRFGAGVASRLSTAFERSTGGHPLLMHLVAADLVERGVLHLDEDGWTLENNDARGDLPPAAVSELVERIVAHLSSDEVDVLEAGSLCGSEFDSSLVARMLERDSELVEATCRSAAQRSALVKHQGEMTWPCGETGERFVFRHDLYRGHLRQRILPTRRARLHRLAAEALERGYGGNSQEVAGTVAQHFEQAGDLARAVPYLEMAAMNEIQRCSHATAAEKIRIAIGYRDRSPQSPDQRLHVAWLSRLLADLRTSVAGYGDPAIEAAFRRAKHLYEEAGDQRGRLRTSFGLSGHLAARGLYREMGDVTSRVVELSENVCHQSGPRVDRDECQRLCHGDCPALRTQACTYRSIWLLSTGAVEEARRLLEAALEFPIEQPLPVLVDVRTLAQSTLVIALTACGRLGEARARRSETLDHARATGLVAPLLHALTCGAIAAVLERDFESRTRLTDEILALCEVHGYPSYSLGAKMLRLSLHSDAERATQAGYEVDEVLRERASLGERFHESLSLVGTVETALKLGDVAGAAATLGRVRRFAHDSGERWMDPEIERLDAELHLVMEDDETAERLYRSAAALAASRGAHLFELRATIGLARLLERDGRKPEARARLIEVLTPLRFEPRSADIEEAAAMLQAGTRKRTTGARVA